MTEDPSPILPAEAPLGDILRLHAALDPARPMLTHAGVTLSREELDALANRRAHLLAELGVGAGDVVIIALPNGLEFFETTFACWKLGATPCPVSPRLPDGELRAIVELADPALVIGPDPSRLAGRAVLAGGALPAARHGADPLGNPVAPFWKAITSGGSTGRPKIIVANAPGTGDPRGSGYLGQRPGGAILSPGPLYHNAAFSAAHQCLFGGGHVVNMERFDPEEALRLIETHRVAHVVMVPTMMARIWRLGRERLAEFDVSSLERVVHLGAPCPVWLKEAWIDWLGPERILEVYAGTEAIGGTTITGAEWLAHRGSVGRPPAGVEIRVLDEVGVQRPTGEIGEIYFRQTAARPAASHYIGATARMAGDWTSLGDLGRVDADGYLYLADRRTDLIVSGGVNIYPAEVEAALDRHPAVCASVVVGLPDEDLGARVHAILQVAPDAADRVEATDILAFLQRELVRYKIPRTLEFVTEDLRDEAGKVRRTQLREDRLTAIPHG